MADNETLMSPEFRVSFPNVFRPQAAMEAGKPPKYGLTMLFKKGEDLSKLKAAAAAAVKARWGDSPPKNLRSPFRDQGEKNFEGYEEGAIFVSATSMQKPGLVDAQVQTIIDESEFYPGCYAQATLRAFAYPAAGKPDLGNRGVAFGLQNIQKLRDGDPLGGRTNPENDFAPVETADAGGDAGGMFD